MKDPYLAWATTQLGVDLYEGVLLTDLGNDERGLYASQSIPAGTIIARLPLSSLMTIEACAEIPSLNPLLSTPSMREDDLLSLLLLYERFVLCDQSKFHLHILSLPKEYHSIVNYTEDELEEIKGTNLYITAKRWKIQIQNDFEGLCASLQGSIILDELGAFLTLDTYTWALCTIWSRFITVDKLDGSSVMRAMVPLVDFLNHSPTSRVGHIVKSGSEFVLITQDDIEPRSEIFLNYGANSNSRLLMLYGFTIYGNPNSSVEIFANADPNDPRFLLKREALLACDIECQSEPFVISQSNPFPHKLLIFLRIQISSKETVDELKLAKDGPLDTDEEEIVCDSLIDSIQTMVDGYSMKLDEEEILIQKLGIPSRLFIPPHERSVHALILRHSEKVLLVQALNLLEEYKTSL